MPAVAFMAFAPAITYGLNVIVGALETAFDENSLTIRFPSKLDELIADCTSALKKADRVIVAWSFFSLDFKERAAQVRQFKSLLPDERILHVAGGVHATAEPAMTLKAGFDLVALGEGEITVINLVRCLRVGKGPLPLRGLAGWRGGRVSSRESGWDLDLNAFPPFAARCGRFNPIEITRGCIYGCKFCQTPFMFKARFRHRSVANICRHVETMIRHGLFDVRFISPSSLSYGSPDQSVCLDCLEQLLSGVRQTLGNKGRIFFGTFPSEVRPEHVTPEVLRLLKQYVANDNLVIGGQSGSDRLLRAARRRHSAEAVLAAVRYSLEAGFKANVDLIFGLPDETVEDFQASISLARKIGEAGGRVHAHFFMPLPGTPFKNASPTPLTPARLAALNRLAGQASLYGQWREQIQVARQLARAH